MPLWRNRFLLLSSVLLAVCVVVAMGSVENGSTINLQSGPDSVFLVSGAGGSELKPSGTGGWTNESAKVNFSLHGKGLAVELESPGTAVKSLEIRWKVRPDANWKYLGDAWERAYGDLAWLPLDARRVMPWYFLASDGNATTGFGVKTGPGALCYWTVNAEFIDQGNRGPVSWLGL
jgi:hypothetical protein